MTGRGFFHVGAFRDRSASCRNGSNVILLRLLIACCCRVLLLWWSIGGKGRVGSPASSYGEFLRIMPHRTPITVGHFPFLHGMAVCDGRVGWLSLRMRSFRCLPTNTWTRRRRRRRRNPLGRVVHLFFGIAHRLRDGVFHVTRSRLDFHA